MWKLLSSTAPKVEIVSCCYVESVGKLFVGGRDSNGDCIYNYDIEKNLWELERLPHPFGNVRRMFTLGDFLYIIMHCNQQPQRYSFSKCQWQCFTKVGITNVDSNNVFYNCGTAILCSKVYVLYGNKIISNRMWSMQKARLHCFDPEKNDWEEKARTCHPHFGSSLFVVNSRLYVAGGSVSINDFSVPAPVEVYNEENNTWAVVEQKHIPPNNLRAVEIEGRVYFIINTFPVDSGIRIPSGELYPVPLGEWENFGKIDRNAVLCNMSVKQENILKTE